MSQRESEKPGRDALDVSHPSLSRANARLSSELSPNHISLEKMDGGAGEEAVLDPDGNADASPWAYERRLN